MRRRSKNSAQSAVTALRTTFSHKSPRENVQIVDECSTGIVGIQESRSARICISNSPQIHGNTQFFSYFRMLRGQSIVVGEYSALNPLTRAKPWDRLRKRMVHESGSIPLEPPIVFFDDFYFATLFQMLLLIVFPVVTMSICYARVAVIVYTSSKSRLALSQAMYAHFLRWHQGCFQSDAFRVAFSKAATDAVHFSGYSTIPMISTSRQLKTATSTINAYTKHKSARVAEANKKQVRSRYRWISRVWILLFR